MAIINSIPKLVSTKILYTLRNELVGKKICTMEPDAPITKTGDTVYFSGMTRPSISAYTGSISYETLDDGTVALLIDQKNHYAFKVDDIEAFQSNIDVKGSSVSEAAYGLLNSADQYIFGLYSQAGLSNTETVSEANVLSTTSKTIRLLREQNVRPGNTWLAIPEWYKELLELAGVKFQIKSGINGSDGLSWVKYLDADLYVTNNLTQTGSEGSYETKIMGGSYNSIVYAEQMLKNRFIPELEDSFAGGASGLHVFGAKVIKPNEVITLTATQSAPTTI